MQLVNAKPNDSIVNMKKFTQGRLGMCKIIYKAMLVLVVACSQLFAGDLLNLFLYGRNTSGYYSAERQIEENTRGIRSDMDDLEDEVDESADKIVDAVKKSRLPKNKASIFFNSVLASFNERYPVELQGYAHAMVVTAKRYKMNLIKLNRVLVEDAMMEGGIAYTEAEIDAILYKNLDELGFYLKQGKYFLDGEHVNMGSFSRKVKNTPIYKRSGSIDVRPKVKIKKLDSARVQVVAKINLPDSLESWIELCKLGEEGCIRSKKQFQDSVITDTLSYGEPGMYYVGVQVNGFLSRNNVRDKIAGPYMENRGGWGRHIHYNSKTIKLK